MYYYKPIRLKELGFRGGGGGDSVASSPKPQHVLKDPSPKYFLDVATSSSTLLPLTNNSP
jgi:hypothetical protein